MSSEAFSELGLASELVRAVADEGYTEPTPIQRQAIPLVLEGRDMMGGAQTGTGKTAAFALPLLQRLMPFANTSFSPARHPVRALILAPTRELAVQVEESVRTYGKHVPLRATAVYGGVDIDPQLEALRKGVEILVATPGRLLDHMQQRSVNLATVQVLVLDEADRMLDMGFFPDISRILAVLPSARQNLLFSATFPPEVKRLADSILRNPVMVQVTPRNSAAELVQQSVHTVPEAEKRSVLIRMLTERVLPQALVFVNTKQGAGRLARTLKEAGLSADSIHSDKTQTERLATLNGFKEGNIAVLVATDIAARGLDIDELPLVVNYDVPYNAEDYVHRIGRTGRAGSEGEAVSLVSPAEETLLSDIERLLKRKIERRPLPRPAAVIAPRRPDSPRLAPQAPVVGPALLGATPIAKPAYLLGEHQNGASRSARPKEVAMLLGGGKKEVKPA